jgi:hypothetical protein
MDLLVFLPGGEPPARRDLSKPLAAGGSRADDVFLPSCPAGALRLVPCPAGAVVEAVASGVRVGGHAVHAGARRLLRPGERAELHGAALALDRRPAASEPTRIAAAALLRNAAAGSPPSLGLHLLVLTGPAAGTRHGLGPEQTIGRGRAATIVLPDPSASRVHARLLLGPDGARIEDLRSKNGVRVNGVRVERRSFPFRSGDELVVGETVLALTEAEEDAEGMESSPPSPGPSGRRRLSARLVAAALLSLSAAALALAAT